MDRKEFTEKAFRVAGEARTHSASQMLELRRHQTFINRVGKVALGKSLALVYPPTFRDYPMLGGGCEQVVYASDDEVLKIISASMTTNKQEARAAAATAQQTHDSCRSYLGAHWHETVFEAVKVKRLSAVAAIQPRITEGHGYETSEEVAKEGGKEYAPEQLSSLHAAVLRLHDETSLYPDIIGAQNIFLNTAEKDGHQLVIVDTLPISSIIQERPIPHIGMTVGELILKKLNDWNEAIGFMKEHSGTAEPVLH